MTCLTLDNEVPVTSALQARDTSWTTRRLAVLFTILLAAAFAARLAAPTGWLGSDDAAYFSAAEQLLSGETIQRVHHHNARATMVVPVAVSVWLFGANVQAVILPTLVVSMLCVVLIAVVGRLLWGWTEGLIAAAVVAFLPYFRVMSTVAFPDVHVCFWSTLSVVLALWAAQSQGLRRRLMLGTVCGFAIGLAFSAKVFGVFTIVPVLWIAGFRLPGSWRQRLKWMSSVGAGLLAFFVLDGLFYTWATGDFFFKWHAIENAKADDRYFPASGYFRHSTYVELVWYRLTMLFRPAASGWGTTAVLFVPAALLSFVWSTRARAMAAWAVVTYVAIACAPVTLRHHWHPFTPFDGRHILITCVPFALCFSWLVCGTMSHAMSPARLRRGLFVLIPALAVLSVLDGAALRGFRDRDTQRCGAAIEQIVASEDWDNDREIFLPASLYLRHRLLFPAALQPRLRVAVDDDAPDWWRHASADITSRKAELPPPGKAYLIATPEQLAGRLEFWDYGVALPKRALAKWQHRRPRAVVSRYPNKTLRLGNPESNEASEVLVLLGEELAESRPPHAVTVAAPLPPATDGPSS